MQGPDAALPCRLALGGRVIEGEQGFRRALEDCAPQERPALEFGLRWCSPAPALSVRTSGSTGVPHEIRVRKAFMAASARMTAQRLGLREGDTALLCLPLDYIAGQMMVVRAMVSGLRLVVRRPSRHPLQGLELPPDFAAMVPLQVSASLQEPRERSIFASIRETLVGGAAIDPSLAAALRELPCRVWSTYGMTETLSHIALRELSGRRASVWYEPLPGVSISATRRGTLAVSAPAIGVSDLETNDIVAFAPDARRFRILGRLDNIIDSGGIKVPSEVLEESFAAVMDRPFCIASLPDPELGECVAVVVEGGPCPLPEFRESLALGGYSPYWRPRKAVFLPRIPRTRTGKPDRAAIRREARAACGENLRDIP